MRIGREILGTVGMFGRMAAAAAVVWASTALPAAAEMLKVGDPFAFWELSDERGTPVASTDLSGNRYLIWFYPKASTPG